MEKFTTLSGVAAPLPMVNVDTDMIIPKQFLKTIKRTGLKDGLFYEMRWTADGSRLIYSVNFPDDSEPRDGIWRIGADGSDATHVLGSDPDRGQPVVLQVSPDGATVLIQYPELADRLGSDHGEPFWLLDVASGGVTPVTIEGDDVPEYALVSAATHIERDVSRIRAAAAPDADGREPPVGVQPERAASTSA